MNAPLRAFLFSLQTKLAIAFAAVMLLAIFIAGGAFIALTRDDRREQALDRVAATSPAIYQQAIFAATLLPEEQSIEIESNFRELSAEQGVRILVVGPDEQIVVDTAGRLQGYTLVIPAAHRHDLERGYVAWQPGEPIPEGGLTFVSAAGLRVPFRGPFRIVLAVETDTIADAWLGILPGLLLAALVAVPVSSLAAIVLARQIAHPVERLTRATEALAAGDFGQRVEIRRDDEIGRLAASFSSMAQRIGERDAQMRALLANVSHDLKTPMTSIAGYARAIADGTVSREDVTRAAAVIKEESEHVNALLADLLYLSEIDAGQVVTRCADVPIAALVERCLRRVELAARPRGISVSTDVDEAVVLRNVDAEKLERALTNVLDNAAKFAPAGGRIDVRGGVGEGRIVLGVHNTGPAIPDDDLTHIFDRFFRGDRARQTSGGSGLGLAIARELVELNGGHIEARNEHDGVTFVVSFPA